MPAIFEARFQWIRPDVFLVAQVDEKTGRQKLLMQQVDKASGKVLAEDGIDCIHTAVCSIAPEEYEDAVGGADFLKHALALRSSENLPEIRLVPREKFKAFTSWVSGIAEAGSDAFRIQAEVEAYASLVYPIATPLLRFAAQVEPSFLPEYFDTIERDCRHEGTRHFPSLLANLLPLIDAIGDYDDEIEGARETIDRIIDIIGDDSIPYTRAFEDFCFNLGEAFTLARNYFGAKWVYERLIAINGSQIRAWQKLGTVLTKARLFKAAVEFYEKAVARFPKAIWAWNNLAASRCDISNYHGAVEAYLIALALNHHDSYAWEGLGFAFYQLGKRKSAIRAFLKVTKMTFKDSGIYLGWAQFAEGDFEGALATFHRLLAHYPQYAEGWYWLGDIYRKKEQWNDAVQCLEKAAKLGNSRAPMDLVKIRRDITWRGRITKGNSPANHRKRWGGARAQRQANLKQGVYEPATRPAPEHFVRNHRRSVKSNRHHRSTARKEAYRAGAKKKRQETPTI